MFGAVLALGSPAAAQTTGNFWFAGTNLIFANAQSRAGDTAVATGDPGLAHLLAKVGASLSYDPGQRYVVVTSGDRRTIVFTIGDARYSTAGVVGTAPFAPYAQGGVAYLPLSALARALYVVPVEQAGATVLQPQLGALDVRSQGAVTQVTLRAALPLRFKRVSAAGDERLILDFTAVGSSLPASRSLGGALRTLSIVQSGSVRNPTTTVTFDAAPGSAYVLAPSHTPNEIVVAFAARGSQLAGIAVPPAGDATSAAAGIARSDVAPAGTQATDEYGPLPSTVPASAAVAPPPLERAAQITSLDTVPSADGTLAIHVGASGSFAYEWHRLPDGRWFIDLKNATLATPAREEQPPGGVADSLRLRQISPGPDPVVRIAISLASPRRVDVLPAAGGFTLAVAAVDDIAALHSGTGHVAPGAIVADAQAPESSAPDLWTQPAPLATPSHLPVATNPRLIVIDPGHGGSDAGAAHNGLVEKDLTLEISRRLRDLLIARGWQVKMTRDTDVDVFAPNDSAHDELQARCDIANAAGARMFVSVHVNSFTNSSLDGTTTYYYKHDDEPLGEAIHRRLAGALPTADRGLRKENFYVIHHTDMPAVLVETAFLSNQSDAAHLRSPAFIQAVVLAIADGIGDFAPNGTKVITPASDGL